MITDNHWLQPYIKYDPRLHAHNRFGLCLMAPQWHQTAFLSSDYGWQLRFTYRVFTPATFGSRLDALPAVFGIGIDALVPLCMENKERREEEAESEGAVAQHRPCKVSSPLSPPCLYISSSGTLCGSMVIGDRDGIFCLFHYPLRSVMLRWISG